MNDVLKNVYESENVYQILRKKSESDQEYKENQRTTRDKINDKWCTLAKKKVDYAESAIKITTINHKIVNQLTNVIVYETIIKTRQETSGRGCPILSEYSPRFD